MTDHSQRDHSANLARGSEQGFQLPQHNRSPISSGSPAAQVIGESVSDPDRAAMTAIASDILSDPIAQRLLADRIYDLMRQDLKQQQQRRFGYGGRTP